MLRLEHPQALYLLGLWLPLAGVFALFLLWRRRAMLRFGDPALVARLAADRPRMKHSLKFLLFSLAWACLVLALANPQIGRKVETVKRKGVDLMLALDISNSMMAEDEKPSRLLKARQLISRLLDKASGDRIGLICFAGNAYVQAPMTTDYGAVKTLLREAEPDRAYIQGTSLSDAIRQALRAFKRLEAKSPVLVLISDGEDHEEGVLEAAREARELGVVIHTVGAGSSAGAPIPVFENGKPAGFKTGPDGSIVVSRLNEQMLQDVAAAGGGQYFSLRYGSALATELRAALDQLEQQEIDQKSFTDYEDQFQWFLLAALLLLTLEYATSERKSNLFDNWNLFGESSSRT